MFGYFVSLLVQNAHLVMLRTAVNLLLVKSTSMKKWFIMNVEINAENLKMID